MKEPTPARVKQSLPTQLPAPIRPQYHYYSNQYQGSCNGDGRAPEKPSELFGEPEKKPPGDLLPVVPYAEDKGGHESHASVTKGSESLTHPQCDRLKPCSSCCLRGTPNKCNYDISEDTKVYITQANEIKRLRKHVRDLELQLSQRYAVDSDSSRAIVPGPSGATSSTGAAKCLSYNQVRKLFSNLPPAHFAWAEHPFIPINAVNGIYMAPPNLVHLSSRPSLDAAMLSNFIDCVSMRPATGVTNWIRAIAEVAPQSQLLSSAFQAMASLYFALQCSNPSLLQECQRLHLQTLTTLRQEVSMPRGESGYFTLYTMLLLIFFELASFDNPLAWMVHIGGAEKIVQQLGPKAFMSGLPRETYVLFTFFSFILKIFQRKGAFIADEDWLVPLQSEGLWQDPYIQLGRLITEIPGILEHAEVIHQNSDGAKRDTPESAQASKLLTDRIHRLEHKLEIWEDMMGVNADSSTLATTLALDKPRNLSLDEVNSYAGFDPSTTMCVYLTARLLLGRMDRRVDHAPKEKVTQWAVSICQIAQENVPHVRDLFSAVAYLFTLRTAFYTLPPASNGRKWIEGIFDAIAKRFGLPLARSIITDLPGPQGPIVPV